MKKIGLRERKSAKLKLGLAETLVELLEQRPLEEISVRELCEAHEISEATFFNYYFKMYRRFLINSTINSAFHLIKKHPICL